MKIKASAGSALILAAGLLCFAAAPPATAAGQGNDTAKSESATSDKSAKQETRSLKKRDAHRKHTRAASKSADTKSAETKSAETKKTEEQQVADAGGTTTPAIPDWVANARAQMMSTDAAPDGAKAMSAAMSEKANTVLQEATDKPADAQAASADGAAVATDQLSDADRSLHLQETPSTQADSAQTVAMASAKPASENPAQAANNDSSTLDKTSLIGKVFIAFGALLTMASAARMFMA